VQFTVFAGRREFNPMAIVFEPFTWAERVRFHQAFRAFKHGEPADVEALHLQLLARLDALAPLDAA
jgi:hypothetical protein